MNSTVQNEGVAKPIAEMTFRLSSMNVAFTQDAGQVRVGGFGPAFRVAAVADAAKVRLGGFGPLFR